MLRIDFSKHYVTMKRAGMLNWRRWGNAMNQKSNPDRRLGIKDPHGWTYDDLHEITGLSLAAIYQHKARMSFDPDNLLSVVIWVARHAKREVKQQIIDYALEKNPVNPHVKKPGSK